MNSDTHPSLVHLGERWDIAEDGQAELTKAIEDAMVERMTREALGLLREYEATR